MTLVVAIPGPDWIVMSADRVHMVQNPIGGHSVLTAIKLRRLGKCGVGFAGQEPVLKLVDELERRLGTTEGDIDTITDRVVELSRQLHKEWYSPRLDFAQADVSFLLAGFRGPEAKLYELQASLNFDPMPHEGLGFVGISGHALAVGMKVAQWPRLLDRDRAAALASFLVYESGRCVVEIGDVVDVGIVTPGTGLELFRESDRAQLNASAKSLSDDLVEMIRARIFGAVH